MAAALITPAYTFTPGAAGVGTVNLSGISNFSIKRLIAVINVTRGVVIYSPVAYATSVSTTTLTLSVDTSTHSSGDTLWVKYDEGDYLSAGATSIAKAEDSASANADVGVPIMAVRKATPADTSGTDGDYEMFQIKDGRLYTRSNIEVGGSAASASNPVPITGKAFAGEYETVAASQTAQVIGATGAAGDFISHITVIPASVSPGSIALLDNATSITVFAGGASSLSNLAPFCIPLNMFSVSGAWKITTGANVSCIAVGDFT